MVTRRNDTLSAQIIGAAFLSCSTNESPNLCFTWQYQQVVISTVMIIFMAIIVAFSTYQLCCVKSTSKVKINPAIQCTSLTYLYCIWITFILHLLVALFIFEPFGNFGWEWSDTNGWIYDSTTPGWQWESKNPLQPRDGNWEYNNYGSWQWNDDGNGGWYFDQYWDVNMTVGIIMWCVIILVFTLGSCSGVFAYMYQFKRLSFSFHGTTYQIPKNSVNAHYLNAVIIFFITAMGCVYHMFGDLFTSYRLFMASSAFSCIGLLFMMYQFNTRLFTLIKINSKSGNSSTAKPSENDKNHDMHSDKTKENQTQLTVYQMRLLYVVIKHSTLTDWGMSQMYHFPSVAVGQLSMSICIFLGFHSNRLVYDKLCFLCYTQCNDYCHKIAEGQVVQQQTELSKMSQTVKNNTEMSTT
eukprot:379269_1